MFACVIMNCLGILKSFPTWGDITRLHRLGLVCSLAFHGGSTVSVIATTEVKNNKNNKYYYYYDYYSNNKFWRSSL